MSLKTLVVDDSRLARKLIKDELAAIESLEILEAKNGKEALDICSQQKIDLMFLDLTMPEIDGYQVLDILKKEGSDISVFVVSADVQPKARERVLALGAKAFLEKQVTREKIQTLLKENGLI